MGLYRPCCQPHLPGAAGQHDGLVIAVALAGWRASALYAERPNVGGLGTAAECQTLRISED